MMAKVSPQPSSEKESTKTKDSEEYHEVVINDQKINSNAEDTTKKKRKLPRSVSQIVEEREEAEKNIVSRFSSRIEQQGYSRGLMDALTNEVQLSANRVQNMIQSVFRALSCKAKVDKYNDENEDEGKVINRSGKDDDIDSKRPAPR